MSNMVVQTNVLALNSHRNMKTVGAVQAKSSQRLSSGYRVNSAADDAAGLAISEKMRAQIRGLDQASRNAQDGQALIQTAEGGMQEIDNMLQRVRELVVQAANDTNDAITFDRQKLQDEVAQMVQEIDSMADRVEFNAKKLIDGSYASNSDTSTAATSARTAASTRASAASLAYSTASVNASNNSTTTNVNIRVAASTTASVTASMHSLISNQASTLLLAATASTNSLWFQIGANAGQKAEISIGRIKSDVLGIGDGNGKATITVDNSHAEPISSLLTELDTALKFVTTERSKLGAVQNRLEYTMKSLDVSSENLSDSESRIRDADMAQEMMTFTKSNVLQQAAVSMLAQANQLPQNLLQLLR